MATATSTLNKNSVIYKGSPDANASGITVYGYTDGTTIRRSLINVTMPADPGGGTVISSVRLYFYVSACSASTAANVHALTQTGWGEATATWNKYDGVNAWASAGGDFSATVIDTSAAVAASNWAYVELMGAGATNPLTLDWGDSIDVILRTSDEGAADKYFGARSRTYSNASLRPYLEVTYTLNTSLVVADSTHAHSADNIVLTQAHTLVVADSSHAHSADNVKLTEHYTLVVAGAIHAHSADSVTLTQAHTLVVSDCAHAHTADNIALIQAHTLVVADTNHAMSSSSYAAPYTQAYGTFMLDHATGIDSDNTYAFSDNEALNVYGGVASAAYANGIGIVKVSGRIFPEQEMVYVDGAWYCNDCYRRRYPKKYLDEWKIQDDDDAMRSDVY